MWREKTHTHTWLAWRTKFTHFWFSALIFFSFSRWRKNSIQGYTPEQSTHRKCREKKTQYKINKPTLKRFCISLSHLLLQARDIFSKGTASATHCAIRIEPTYFFFHFLRIEIVLFHFVKFLFYFIFGIFWAPSSCLTGWWPTKEHSPPNC